MLTKKLFRHYMRHRSTAAAPPVPLVRSGRSRRCAPALMYKTNVCLSVCLSVFINNIETTKHSANNLLPVNKDYMSVSLVHKIHSRSYSVVTSCISSSPPNTV